MTEALADGGLDRPAAVVDGHHGAAPSLRWIVSHLIEECARHNGHADLLRESVDGLTGECMEGDRPGKAATLYATYLQISLAAGGRGS